MTLQAQIALVLRFMTVAFDLRQDTGSLSPFFKNQLSNFVVKLAVARPDDSFIIYGLSGNKAGDGDLPHNVSFQPGKFPRTGSLLARLFAKPVASAALLFKIFTPAVRISTDDVLLIADLSPLVHPEHFTSRETARFRRKLRKAIATAKALVVCTSYYHQFLLTALKVPEEKLHFWDLAVPATLKESGWEEKEKVKEAFTAGTEYFLFAGDLHPRHELVTLLKAFSEFKKWQRSGMKLVLAAYESMSAKELYSLLTNYKFRDDVILVKDPADHDLQQLIAACYCVVYPSRFDPFPQIIRYAMSLKAPVITSDIPEIRSLGGDGLIYAATTVQELSPFMQRVFKDESWRSGVISKAYAGVVKEERQIADLFRKIVDG
jgi:glycosyltransferase involved in cell wall biosynthesis